MRNSGRGSDRRLLRATIVNCYPDHNKGSAALAAGLISRLRATGAVGDITVIALPQAIQLDTDYRHLARSHPDVTVFPSPLRDQDPSVATHKLRKAAYTGYISARTLGIRASVVHARHGADPALSALAHSDVVLERGGPFFKGLGPPPNPSLLRYAWPLHFARQAGIPYALVGESVGPLANPWARQVVRRLVLGSGLTSVREDISRDVLEDAGVPVGRVSTMLDNAFWTVPRRSPAVDRVLQEHSLVPGRFLAVTCRDRRTRGEEDAYLRDLAGAIRELVPSTFDSVAVVPNLFNPAGPDHDDRRMGRRLLEFVESKDSVRLVEADLAPDEMAALYGQAALVLGHRLHSLILGVVGGTPVVGVASSVGPKTIGVLQLLGLSEFVVPIKDLKREDVVVKARAALTAQAGVAQRVDTLRRRSDSEFLDFVEAVVHARARSERVIAPPRAQVTDLSVDRAPEHG